jgi:putative transposase
VKARLDQVLRGVAKENAWSMVAMEVMSDHVHLFVAVGPLRSPHLIVQAYKGRSSRVLREEFPHLMRMNTLGTRSYFVGSTGNASSATIRTYIEQQWGHGTPKDN